MKLNLLSQNSKLKKSGDASSVAFNFGIPALKSKTGEFTCPNAKACAVGCYAKSGAYLFSNVAAKFEQRFEATKQKDFVRLIQADLDLIKKRYQGKAKIYIRIHDSGDFYSPEYFEKWLYITELNPDLNFYAYTKMVSMVSGYDLPENFRVIYSYGGKEDKLINQKSSRHSLVFKNEIELKSAGYINASENDLLALTENKKIGLVFHHAKKIENTLWEKTKSEVIKS